MIDSSHILPYLSSIADIRSTTLSTCHIGPTCMPFLTYSPGKWQVQRYIWSHLSPWLHANLRSLSPRKNPSEQLFFPALRSRGANRALRHIYPASLPEIIPHPHGVVFTNFSRTLSINRKLIELHHERTSTGTIESHNGSKTWNTDAWKQITKVDTKILNIGLPIFANLGHFVQR